MNILYLTSNMKTTKGKIRCSSESPSKHQQLRSKIESTTLQETLRRFFSPVNEDEDNKSTMKNLLEDKVIPRHSDTSSDSSRSREIELATFRRFSDRRASSNRTFQRRASDVYCRGRSRMSEGYPRQDIRLSSICLTDSPDGTRKKRSTSLATTRETLDPTKYLQTKKQNGETRTPTPSPSKYRKERYRASSMPTQRPKFGAQRRHALHGASEAGLDVEYYRIRSFSVSANGNVCNLGDTFRSRSISSVASSNSAKTSRSRLHSNSSQYQIQCTGGGSGTNDEGGTKAKGPYKVAMLGASGVGKTSLTWRFCSSEYICHYDASLDEEYDQKNVSVMINGEETEMEIIDHPAAEMSVEAFCSTYTADVFVVVYSVIDQSSLKEAENILHYLCDRGCVQNAGAILVANKADLERKREVSNHVGRRVAHSFGIKFIETSSGISHNVDELLVGILAQIQLNAKRRKKKNRNKLINKLLSFRKSAKSCENLFKL